MNNIPSGMDLSIPPTPLPGGLPGGGSRCRRPIFRKIQNSDLPPYKPLFQLPFFIASDPLFGPQVGAFQRPKSPQRLFQANTKKKYKNHCFPKVLATLASIFLPFRTREFIVKYNRIGPRGPFSIVKYSIFIKFHKKNMKISFFEVSFFPPCFGAILVPIWLLFLGPKNFFFFQKLTKIYERELSPPPFIRHFLPSALRTPKMCRKTTKNAPKMLPKMFPRGLQKSFLRCLCAPLRYL